MVAYTNKPAKKVEQVVETSETPKKETKKPIKEKSKK